MLPERAIAFFVIVILTLVGLVWGLINTRRVIEAPFLYATGMALILCPQLYIVASDGSRVPDEAFWVFGIMVVLCTAALYIGYFRRPKLHTSRPRSDELHAINHARLYGLGLAFALLGVFGYYKLSQMGTITVWRGWPVYWLNVLAFLVPGIILMLVAYVNAPTLLRLLPIVLGSVIPLTWIFGSGRRSATLTLPLVYAMPFLIYRKNFRVPRLAIVIGLVLGFIVVYAFPVWRDSFKERDYLQTLQDYPLSEIIDNMFSPSNDKPLEIADGMILTGARYQRGNYEWGSAFYNQLVQNYVPGSLIGYDLKNSFFKGNGVKGDWAKEVYGIPVAFYTSKSGYEDLFAEFSFFGCIVMYWIGRGFRRVHEAAVDRLDGRAVVFLCFFVTFPAGIAYGSIDALVVLAIPQILLMLIAFRWCIQQSQVPCNPQSAIATFATLR